MVELHPEILKKEGKPEFVVLPYEEFVALEELIQDVQDLIELRNAKASEGDAYVSSLEKVKRHFGL